MPLEFFQSWDTTILLWINRTATHPALDFLLPAITDLHKSEWLVVPLLLYFALRQWWDKQWTGIYLLLAFAAAMGIIDALGGQVIKPFFERARPDVAGIDVILRSPHFGGYSFVSNHALNMFCAAGFLLRYSRFWGRIAVFMAFVIAYSRVYCGVHFPSDVVVGGLLGFGWGVLAAWITQWVYERWTGDKSHAG